MNPGIYIFAELTKEKKPSLLTLELLGLGKKLSEKTGEKTSVLLSGSGVSGAADEISAHGISEVVVFDHPILESYNPYIYHSILLDFIEKNPLEFLYRATLLPDRIYFPVCHQVLGQDWLQTVWE